MLEPRPFQWSDWMFSFNVVDAPTRGLKALHFKDDDSAKTFLESVLNNGKCKEKIKDLISAFAMKTGVEAVTTDLVELFDLIVGQSKGGMLLNIPSNLSLDEIMPQAQNAEFGENLFPRYTGEPRPVMGLTTRLWATPQRLGGRTVAFNNEAFLLLQEGVFDPGYGQGQAYLAANTLAHRFIHELLHVAASKGTYGHDDNKTGLKDAVKKLGSPTVADFLIKHCNVPKKELRAK